MEISKKQEGRPSNTGKQARGHQLLRMAADFFQNNLFSQEGEQALSFLRKQCNFSEELIREAGIGYAPNFLDRLGNNLCSCGFSPSELVEFGLCKQQENGQICDFFRNRIIFPFKDHCGGVVAFGGRSFDGTLPRYLLPAETPLFRGHQHLFGLDLAKDCGKEQIILCEGLLDIMAIRMVGIRNVVATIGSCLTIEQAKLLQAYTKRVLISFDNDCLGKKETHRVLGICDKIGLQTAVVNLGQSRDPYGCIRHYGKEAYIVALSKSKQGFQFRMDYVLGKYDLTQVDELIEASKELVALIAQSPSAVTRELYTTAVSKRLAISREALLCDVEKRLKKHVWIYSREAIETCLQDGALAHTAVISFYDPPESGCAPDTPVDYAGKCDRVMQVALHDLDLEALTDFDLTEETYFPEADALAAYIYSAWEDGLNILCQCEYGQSRSAGCAAAILEHFESRGIDVFTDYRYDPNQLIYHKIFDALERYKGKRNAHIV